VLAQPEDEEPVRAALLDAVRPVELRFHLAVHPVVMTAADLADRQADPLVAEIAADGLLLSGRAPGPLRRVRTLPAPARQRPVESAASGGAPVATASVSGAPHARGA
jgi:hypothetical protein